MVVKLLDWSSVLGTNIEIGVDMTSVVILTVVVVIGTAVMTFSYYYMVDDAKLNTFIGLLSGFVTFMMILTISNSLVVLFIG
jgi:NADH:ubiquinone oxidoreductase subunit 5 (subunit L)/multisubunit Na+/H+ antiporter MnhA subunit